MNPIVSIILPTYNGEKFIDRSIQSVLDQSFTDWELIVIDDGSMDDTVRKVWDFSSKDGRIRCLRNENNIGIQKSLNNGLREARGKYVARIDDDDVWIDEDKLKKQVEFFKKNIGYVLVGTGVVVMDEAEKEMLRYVLPEKDSDIRLKMLRKNCFAHSSVMFLREAALSLGGYDESKEGLHVEDYDLWLRMGKIGKFTNLPFYGLGFTLRAGAISSSNKIDQFKKDIDLAKKYKKYYPGILLGLIVGYARIFFYYLFKMIPFGGLKNKLFKIAKEI